MLVCKEWESFGHQFHTRVWGPRLDERSPIFHQWVECVWQLLVSRPEVFEFGEVLLLRLLDALYANTGSEFRYDCDRERWEDMEVGGNRRARPTQRSQLTRALN